MISQKISNSLSGLAAHLVYESLLTDEIASEASEQAKKLNIPFISYLVEKNILSSHCILQTCLKNFGLPLFDLKNYDLAWLDQPYLNIELIHRYHVIPLNKEGNILQVAISDPTEPHALEAIAFHTGFAIIPFLVEETQLAQFIQKNFSASLHKSLQNKLLKAITIEEDLSIIHDNTVNYDEPVIKFVDHIIQHALQQHASDIHLEPFETICRIRYRQDGILYLILEVPIHLASRLITRLKVMAKLDITERRFPQDGRFQMHHTDIRINTCPTLFGEKVVLRLLHNKSYMNIHELGLTDSQKNIFLQKILQPQGLILVTGPTGSGKTVTLYSALHHLNSSEKNISTIEDPVEIQLAGVNQLNINPKINLDFLTALRTFLRQDPDVIMVGEIRDKETATVAIQAAQTGHLVLSTLHTNSAVDTIHRLRSMGIPIYNIISAITLIIAQRLIRKLCNHCKIPEKLPPAILASAGFQQYPDVIFNSKGCQNCLNGFQGRTAIYEVLVLNEPIIDFMATEENTHALTLKIQQEGFFNLRAAGLAKVSQGITSLSEINRVIYQ